MKKIFVFTLFALSVYLSVGQAYGQGQSLVDSLKLMLRNPPNDSVETRWVNSLFGLYLSIDLDSALIYGERAKILAEKTQDSVLIASNTLNFGSYYWYQSNFTQAMESYVRAAAIFDRLGSETDKADAQLNIALIYLIMGEGSKSKPFLYKVLDVYNNNEYWNGVSTGYQYLGVIYDEEANYDSAIYCYENCILYSKKSKIIASQAWGYSGLGQAYQKKGQFDKARKYQLESLKIEEQLGNTPGMLQSYISLGSLEREIGNLQEAEDYFQKAQSMPEIIGDFISQRNLYQEMVKLYEATGEISKAYSSYQKHVAAVDSIKNSEDLATINELNEKYESEKKAREILTLQKDRELDQLTLEKERTQKTIFIIASILFLLLSSGLVFGYLQLRKSKNQIDKRNAMITKMNKALNKSQDELIASNKTKDKFFALIAHDLRGPITSMQGIGRMLAYYHKKGDMARINQLIEQVDQSASSVNHLLDNLLKWALSQTDGLNYQPTKFQLGQLIEEIKIVYEEALKAKQIELRIGNVEEIIVEADRNMVSSVIRNLLSNAIKFSPFSGQITVSVEEKADVAVVSVADSGQGMPQQTIDKILTDQPVGSTQGTLNEKGTGLGLLLCREFTKKHQSDLLIDSSSSGTSISFQLKLVHQTQKAEII
ncbi:MAG: tetratricopeptide repeat-containing sensor histidine kinase [Cyclobacteriaceae bacterium]